MDTERAELHKIIWRIANDLRGSVDGWDFKNYVLGIMSGPGSIVEMTPERPCST